MFRKAILFFLVLASSALADGVVRFTWIDQPEHQNNPVIGWIEVKVPVESHIPGRIRLKRSDVVAWHMSYQHHQIRSEANTSTFEIMSNEELPLMIDRGRLFLVGDDNVGILFRHDYKQQIPEANRFLEILKDGFIDSGNRSIIRYKTTTGFTDAGTSWYEFSSQEGNPHVLGWPIKSVQIGKDGERRGTYIPPEPTPAPDPNVEKIEELKAILARAQELLEELQ